MSRQLDRRPARGAQRAGRSRRQAHRIHLHGYRRQRRLRVRARQRHLRRHADHGVRRRGLRRPALHGGGVGNATVGSGQAAPSPTGVAPDTSECSAATPTPTGSPSTTGTASPTADGKPHRNRHHHHSGPGAAHCDAYGRRRPGPRADARSRSRDRSSATTNRAPTATSSSRSAAVCWAPPSFIDVFSASTDSQGRFTVTDRPTKSAAYIAVVEADDNCEGDTSDEVTVLVRVKLRITPSENNPERGDRIRIKGSLRPQHDGTKMILQRKKNGRFVRFKVDHPQQALVRQLRVPGQVQQGRLPGEVEQPGRRPRRQHEPPDHHPDPVRLRRPAKRPLWGPLFSSRREL